MGNIKNITPDELVKLIELSPDSLEIVDVREPDEYNRAHIKNSKNIPLGDIKERMDDIDWNKTVVFVCRSGGRSMDASYIASSLEKSVNNLDGGMIMFSAGFPDYIEGVFSDF